MKNEMTLTLKAISENEAFARTCVAAFCVALNPTLEEINDIKTAVSEAVTNSVVHAYPDSVGEIKIKVSINNNCVKISICDYGIGINNIERAREPFWTSKPEQERSGMGFTVIESFMDSMDVFNNKNNGITVVMTKKIGQEECLVMGA